MPAPGRLARLLPLIADLGASRGKTLPQDLLAGTITAILLIPQALAYAVLAGLPPEVGLYASILPPVVYALLGSSRTLAVGPVAVAAVMVSSALSAYAGDDAQRYLEGALVLSALTGAILLVLAALRLGWMTHFISHPVLSGFTTGAAIFIIGTQLASLLGVEVPRSHNFVQALGHLLPQLHSSNAVTTVLGLSSVIALLLARKPLVAGLVRLGLGQAKAQIVGRTAPLFLVVLFAGLSASLHWASEFDVRVIGRVPTGLPGLDLSFITSSGWLALLPAAGMIALIGYVESISVARALAFRRNERVDPDRELMSLGVTNVVGACAGSMPVAGGFSRSMVNYEAGAQTQAASIVTAAWVAVGAMFLTGLLENLPAAVLAAIIVVAVSQLINLRGVLHTWRYDKADGAAQAVTIVGVLVLGIEGGLLVGVALGISAFMYRTSRPHIAVVGRIPQTEHFRNVQRHEVETWSSLLLLRVDENIYFANCPRIEDVMMSRVVEQKELRHVILILSGVANIDASGLEMMESFARSLREKGIDLHLAEVKGPVMDRLRQTRLIRELGSAQVHLSTNQAVEALLREPLNKSRTCALQSQIRRGKARAAEE